MRVGGKVPGQDSIPDIARQRKRKAVGDDKVGHWNVVPSVRHAMHGMSRPGLAAAHLYRPVQVVVRVPGNGLADMHGRADGVWPVLAVL